MKRSRYVRARDSKSFNDRRSNSPKLITASVGTFLSARGHTALVGALDATQSVSYSFQCFLPDFRDSRTVSASVIASSHVGSISKHRGTSFIPDASASPQKEENHPSGGTQRF